MEERVCKVSKMVWSEMLAAMPPESRGLTDKYAITPGAERTDGNPTAIILISPFGYRLLFVAE